MRQRGQELAGDVLISTHICQQAHPVPHDPFPFVMSPLPSSEKHPRLVDERMDAILTPETCKGNKMISHLGFAVTPPVREGFILRPHASILHIMEMVTGKAPAVFPITMQDVTPYELGVHHICGMVLPSIFSTAPVVGEPLVTEIQIHPSETIRAAAEKTVHGALPLADNKHKSHLLVNLTERAIERCLLD
jgi:hypothetical protein